MVHFLQVERQMEKMAISKFKAQCLAVLERVRRTQIPILITRFGKPVAQIVPPPPPERPESWIGCMKDHIEITGDIVSPASDLEDWDAFKE